MRCNDDSVGRRQAEQLGSMTQCIERRKGEMRSTAASILELKPDIHGSRYVAKITHIQFEVRSRFDQKRPEYVAADDSRSTFTQEAILWNGLAVSASICISSPRRQVGVGVRLDVPSQSARRQCPLALTLREDSHWLMYAAVGKSGGSHPMLMLSGSW